MRPTKQFRNEEKKIQFIWSEEMKRNQIKTDFAWNKRDKGGFQPAPNI